MEVAPLENITKKNSRGSIPSSHLVPGKSASYDAFLSSKKRVMSSPEFKTRDKIPSPKIPIITNAESPDSRQTYVEDVSDEDSLYIRDRKSHGSPCLSPELVVSMGNSGSYVLNSGSFHSSRMKIKSPSVIMRENSLKQFNITPSKQLKDKFRVPDFDFDSKKPTIDLDFESSTLNNKEISVTDKRLEDLTKKIELLTEYMLDQQQKSTRQKEQSQSNYNAETAFKIPKSVPVSMSQKKKIEFENLSPVEMYRVKERFKLLYRDLINKYSGWDIKEPDYETVPLKIIHETYEKLIKTICIYQNAMKWKVYLVILFAGIEYYGYNVKGFVFLKGLLKSQIKTIHKYDNYLIEFSQSFYTDSDGNEEEEYPFWVRFSGTLFSSLTCFSTINGLSNKINIEAPEMVFHEADKFVSPPEGPAKLHSDGISEVPEPPSNLQDPNNIINIIGSMWGMFTGGSNTKIPTAEARPETDKGMNYDDVEI